MQAQPQTFYPTLFIAGILMWGAWPVFGAAVPEGTVAEGGERRGESHLHRDYYASGAVRLEGRMVGEKRQGLFSSFYENGQLQWRGRYEAGKEQGLFRHYDITGRVSFEVEFRDGVLDGWVRSFSPRGRLIREVYYRQASDPASELIQMASAHAESQEPMTVTAPALGHDPWDNVDPRYGLWKDYYQSGQLKAVRFYKNNLLEGVEEEYYENGQLKALNVYRHGTLIRRKQYDPSGREVTMAATVVE